MQGGDGDVSFAEASSPCLLPWTVCLSGAHREGEVLCTLVTFYKMQFQNRKPRIFPQIPQSLFRSFVVVPSLFLTTLPFSPKSKSMIKSLKSKTEGRTKGKNGLKTMS